MRGGLLAALLFIAGTLSAQGPSADWRTIETAHFRVHYPREYEQWAHRAAGRLESVRDVVSREAGFAPPQTIDVLVTNPVAEANGSAWPLLDTPRMILFAEPPGPDEVIGAYGHWIDLLTVHETAHLVHMLRPSRNPMARLLERSLLPLNPITLRAPRWVLEGYATVLEGRVTGSGRPASTMRALILRQWAAEGRLPSYGQLSADRRFLGMSMAYLAGSAYLEWLERRAGPDALRNLWARMTAREKRSFDEAFAGVFGDAPAKLYGRFAAELTASAVAVRRAGPLVEGDLFQQTAHASGDPAVSPDGSLIAYVVRGRDKPDRLVVWATAAPADEEKEFRDRLDRILARDPEDVAPVRTRPLARKARHELVLPGGGDIVAPRWTAGGKSIVFSHREPDPQGFLHFDLFEWDFERVRRITHLADVREADPLPGGKALALRSRFGAMQLVTVDLVSGAVTPRDEPSIDRVLAAPRAAADGRSAAWIEHMDGSWALMVDGARVPLPGDVVAAEWTPEGGLIASVTRDGFAELYRVVRDGPAAQLTRTSGGAFEPAPSPDGRIFFTSLEPDGFVLRALVPGEPVAPWNLDDSSLVPAIPPRPAPAIPLPAAPLPPPRPYGAGRQEFSWLLGQNLASDQNAIEAAIRLGDVVGRLNALVLGSVSLDNAPEGGALAVMWRGWPVETGIHVWSVSDAAVAGIAEETGAELRGEWTRHFPRARLLLSAGVTSEPLTFASAVLNTRQAGDSWRLDESIRLDADESHWRGEVAASFAAGSFRLLAGYRHDDGESMRLGGLASSILPRSALLHRVLDPALPPFVASGDAYDGWRLEARIPGLPLAAFYRRHEIGGTTISLAGAGFDVALPQTPVLKLPRIDLTAGAAYVLDPPLEGETRLWLGMTWRP